MSLNKLQKDRESGVQVNKEYYVPLDKLRIRKGANVRDPLSGVGLETVKRYALEMHNQVNNPDTGNKLMFPALDVTVENGEIYIEDGEHRYYAALEANKTHKTGIRRIKVTEVQLTSPLEQLKLRMKKEGRQNNAVERGRGYKRMQALGLTVAEIATEMHTSEQTINNCIKLLSFDQKIIDAIMEGRISPTLVQTIGEAAALRQLNNTPKEKVTHKDTGMYRPSMGKSVVSKLAAIVPEPVEGGMQLTIPTEDWEEVRKVIQSLKK